MLSFGRTLRAVLTVAVMCVGTLAAASAAPVTVVVNGSTVNFDQPPVERTGRVFVPLRGVFERLGASVVYGHGDINATGNGRNIHLHIGSNQATVNGQSTTIDVAPFLIGARTMVPLRFVAQALGATVNYNSSNNVVSINGSGGNAGAPPASTSNFSLQNEHPGSGATTGAANPPISATFSEAVDPNSLHIMLDGRDVTSSAYASSSRFDFTSPTALPAGDHTVRVTGKTQSGTAFDKSWTFHDTAGLSNFINRITPAAGTKQGSSFTLSGHTKAGSRVTITATGQALIGGVIPVGSGTFHNSTTADGTGYFSLQVNIGAIPGGTIKVIIDSVAPDGGAKQATLSYPS